MTLDTRIGELAFLRLPVCFFNRSRVLKYKVQG